MTSNYYLKYEKERSLDCAQKIYSGYLTRTNYKTAQDIFNNLKDDYEKNKFLKTSFFYYYRGPYITDNKDWQEKIDEGFIFIILISVLETIMSPFDYEDFGNWVNKNKKTENAEVLWKEWSDIFGTTKKIRDFFEKYVSEDNKKLFLSNISRRDKSTKQMIEYDDIVKVANLFYSLRSEYVHNSEIIPIRENVAARFPFKGVDHINDIDFKKLREILEASFLNYFLEKAGEVKIVEGK